MTAARDIPDPSYGPTLSPGDAQTAAPTPSSSATATPPSKRPIAGGAKPAKQVPAKQGEPMSVQGQWAHIHRLRADIPGWAGDHSHPEHEYTKALRAYKKHDGTPCTSSKDLTFDQAKNLIQRMSGKVQLNEDRARDMGYHADVTSIDSIREAISAKEADGDESLEMDVLSLYGVNKLSELAPEHHPGALALAMAWKTGAYITIRQKIASQLP